MRPLYMFFSKDFESFEERLGKAVGNRRTVLPEYEEMLNVLRVAHEKGVRMTEQGIDMNMRHQFNVGGKAVNVIIRRDKPGLMVRLLGR